MWGDMDGRMRRRAQDGAAGADVQTDNAPTAKYIVGATDLALPMESG